MTRFRQATAGDVDAILGMMRGYYEQDGYTFVEAEARAAALALIGDPHLGRLWVTCDGARVVGYVAVALDTALELYRRWGFADYDRYLMTKWLTGSKRAPRGAAGRRRAPRSGRRSSPARG